VLTASTAQAEVGTQATVHCNGRQAISSSGSTANIPVFYFGFSPVRDCLLSEGDGYNGGGEAEAVRHLQHSLVYCNNGGVLGAIDGKYGPKTRDVVTFIQAASGIAPDGVYGPDTRKVLKWAFYNNDTGRRSCRNIS
jgi:hypothetical protein